MLGAEAQEQIKIFEWANFYSWKYPELDLMFHIPNGGSRNKIEAYNLKRQGTKSGVPDLFMPTPRGNYNGLFIELKAGKNKASENQKLWIKKLNEQGYKASVCVGFEEAVKEITNYLNLPK